MRLLPTSFFLLPLVSAPQLASVLLKPKASTVGVKKLFFLLSAPTFTLWVANARTAGLGL